MSTSKAPAALGRLLRAFFAGLLATAAVSPGLSTAQVAGPNVNMVSGTTWPDGDPFLQRQNEPSIAVSTRNPLHLLAGANDYRTVDLPGLPEGKETGDAWLGAFRSVDGGGSWRSTLIHGYPQDRESAGLGSPLHGYEAAADPVVRAGTHGLFYYSGIVFDRSLLRSAAFVARFMDLNNETVEPIRYIDTIQVDHFDAGEAFIDKPWLEVDVPRTGARTVTLIVPQGSATVSQSVPCGNVYMAWAEITGQGATLRTRIMFSRSTDCGGTWSTPVPISLTGTVGQGATIAIAPATGSVYVAWRQFHSATVDCVREKGFWKDTSNAWPVASLVVGGVNYTKQQALVILQKSYPASDAPSILAQQLITAKLNELSGAENDAIEQVIADADAWLARFPLGSKPSSAQKQAGLALKDKLEAFNKGLAGSPTCTAATTVYPDAVLVVHSDDAGQSFSAPLQVAAVSPFDQGTSEYSFRTNAYPTIAADETGRAYLAWATRGLATSTANPDPVSGDARIVVTTSNDGSTWTAPKPIDQPALPGHQLFPSLTYNAGKLLLVYNDFRADASGVFERFVLDLLDSTHPMRHTVDVRAAVASPADAPVFTDYSILKPSSQVSRYPFIVTGTSASDAKSLQLQYNPPNLPMFQLGHAPFFGDYLDVAGAPRFVPNVDGTWSHNTAPSTAPVYHAVWTDNRDVVAPKDGNWANYTPVGLDQLRQSTFDPGERAPDCQAGQQGMRNQNIYTSRLAGGLYFAAPSNTRPLTPDFQRAFVVWAQNATDSARTFELEILNQPAGGSASFQQFSQATTLNVTIGSNSSISQTVFVKSSSPAASVDVRVTETGSCGTSCLQSTVRINADSTNPPPADATLQNGETYNPAVLNPAVYNPDVYNPAVLNPAVFNPAVFNVDPSNPAVLNFDLGNPAVLNPAVFNPAVLNPAVFNADAFNNAVMSLAFLNPAVFNPAVLNPAVLNPAVFNPAVFNPAVLNPAVLNPAVFNPAVFNPAVLNPAVFNPAVFNTALTDGSVTEASFEAQNTGNTTAAYSFNLNLPSPPDGLSFQLMIYRLYFVPVANDCQLTEAAHQELLVNDLAPKLNASLYDPNGGDSFFLHPGEKAIATLRVVPDKNAPHPGNPATLNIRDLSVSVVSKEVDTASAALGNTQPGVAQLVAPNVAPLVITTASLLGGLVGAPYNTTLAASGGTLPYAWSAFGALPLGLALSPSGLVSGTPTTAGSYPIVVRVTDGTQLAERALTLTVASLPPPVTILIDTVPTNVTGGQPFTLRFRVEDGGGAPIPGAAVTISFASKGCSAAALSGSLTAVSTADGYVQFPNLSIDRGGYGFTIRATSGASFATTAPINVEGFCDTGSMGSGRVDLSAPLLPNGKVLFAGGTIAIGYGTATAELFDPAGNSGLGSFTLTGSMSTVRTRHETTLLADGRVLVSGGQVVAPAALASAEIYDSAIGTFVATGSMSTARAIHQATLLSDGMVLLSGGGNSIDGVLSSTELFDPAGDAGVGAFGPTGSMSTARTQHTATLLADGRVLVSGGITTGGVVLASAEIYDPATRTFSATGNMSVPRANHASTLLPDGKVLISGGTNVGSLNSAELFDPAGNDGVGTFAPTAPMSAARSYHVSTLLPDGKVLITGNSGGFLTTAELFDPAAGTFSPAGNMNTGRGNHAATLLPSGKVLIAGGQNLATFPSSAELFFPFPPTVFLVTNTADAGTGSLRQAILDANAHPGLDAIHFNIPGAEIQTISPASALPIIADPVLLDATTQPGYVGPPLIRVDGAGLSGSVDGIQLQASNSLIRGLEITRFPSAGITVAGSSGARLESNYLGTDNANALGNLVGIDLVACSGCLITRNVVSGNHATGIGLRSGTTESTISDNRVGTNAAGTIPLGNGGQGIILSDSATSHNMITNNLVSANNGDGVVLYASHHNSVRANKVGTDAGGTAALSNSLIGVYCVNGAHDNVIGGSAPGAGNVIAFTLGNGVVVDASPANRFLGNTVTENSGFGMIVQGAGSTGTAIGGSTPGAGNVITSNGNAGVYLAGGTVGTTVQGNWIGTDTDGTAAKGNGGAGISLTGTSSGHTIGGVALGAGNLVSANASNGITVDGAVSATSIANNKIGITLAGTAPLGNNGDGVGIYNGATGITVADNVIAASTFNGIRLNNVAGNNIQHNWVGTNAALAPGLGNGHQGISVAASSNTTIGGGAGFGNVVAYNGQGGILLESGAASTQILGNVVSGNTGFGIGVIESQTVTIAGNQVGTNAAGTAAWANTGDGVQVAGAEPSGITIGGTGFSDGNVISGNGGNGIAIIGGSTGTTVESNWIGTNRAEMTAIPNALSGIRIAASNNQIGHPPLLPGGNTIAYNGGYGIEVVSGTGNQFIQNRIHDNGNLGILLGPGANHDLNAPVITSAVDDGTWLTVTGTVDVGDPTQSVWLDFFGNDACDPSGFGEGEYVFNQYLLSPAYSDPSGVFHFTLTLLGGPAGTPLTVTARTMGGTLAGDTSQFSACVTVGGVLWTRQFGTTSSDSANAISVDASGVYVTGLTQGTLPGQASSGGRDSFVRKFDFAGNELWTRQFGSAADDSDPGISVDASGVYVAGSTFGTLPGQTSSGGNDAFVRKYDLAGNELWTRQFGSAANEGAGGISVDASGVYVAGGTVGTLPGQIALGGVDAFVRKYDVAGNELWTRQFGSAADEEVLGISINASGVYVAGYTSGTLPGQTSSGAVDAFVRKYDLAGNELWTRQFGSAVFAIVTDISVDASRVFVAGYANGTLPGQTSSGGHDAFVREYDFAGNELWTRQFGSAADDVVNGISVDASSVYVAGYTSGTLPGQTSSGGDDAFVRKYDLAGNELWTRQFGSPSADHVDGISGDTSGAYVVGSTGGTLPGQSSAGSNDAFVIKLVK